MRMLTICRHSLSPPVVSYLHNKGCIALCVENMQRPGGELAPLEVVEMFVTVFCFLKDSAQVTNQVCTVRVTGYSCSI